MLYLTTRSSRTRTSSCFSSGRSTTNPMSGPALPSSSSPSTATARPACASSSSAATTLGSTTWRRAGPNQGPSSSVVIILVGGQWGDEGKGKVIHYLAAKADMVIRSQGGNTAGHTVIPEHGEIQFQLMPSSILYPECLSVTGNDAVADPT